MKTLYIKKHFFIDEQPIAIDELYFSLEFVSQLPKLDPLANLCHAEQLQLLIRQESNLVEADLLVAEPLLEKGEPHDVQEGLHVCGRLYLVLLLGCIS